jgi:hypothetical protein
MAGPDTADDYKANFLLAAKSYARVWGFDAVRTAQLDALSVDRVQAYVTSYNPGDCGWED